MRKTREHATISQRFSFLSEQRIMVHQSMSFSSFYQIYILYTTIWFCSSFRSFHRSRIHREPSTSTLANSRNDDYTAVMIVPTGIGASIGGYAGDALPAARLLSCVVDRLITHPNVLNGVCSSCSHHTSFNDAIYLHNIRVVTCPLHSSYHQVQ